MNVLRVNCCVINNYARKNRYNWGCSQQAETYDILAVRYVKSMKWDFRAGKERELLTRL